MGWHYASSTWNLLYDNGLTSYQIGFSKWMALKSKGMCIMTRNADIKLSRVLFKHVKYDRSSLQQDILVNNLPTCKTTVNMFPIFYPQQLIEQCCLNYHCCIFLQIILYEMKFNSGMIPLNGRVMKKMLDFKSFNFRNPNLISATGALRWMCQMPSREPSWIELFSADSTDLRHRIPGPIMCAPVKITSINLNSSPARANRRYQAI